MDIVALMELCETRVEIVMAILNNSKKVLRCLLLNDFTDISANILPPPFSMTNQINYFVFPKDNKLQESLAEGELAKRVKRSKS